MKIRTTASLLVVLVLVAAGAHAASANSLVKTGFKQYKSESYDQAIETFNQLLKEHPGNVFGQMYLGLVYEKKGDKSKAMEYYKLGAANDSKAKAIVPVDGKKIKLKVSELCQALAEKLAKESK